MANNYSLLLDSLVRSNESELFYTMLGSTRLIDSFYVFFVSPLALVGLVFNALAFGVLVRSSKERRHVDFLLYKYLLFYVFNNILLCLIISLAFMSMSPRYFPWFYSIWARIQRCIMMSSVSLTLMAINRLLELLILCQRLANFRPQFKRIGDASWTWTCVLVVALSCVLNIPFFRNVKSDAQLADDLQHFDANVAFTYCAKDAFYNNTWVNYSKTVSTFLRDFAIVCAEFALSAALIFCCRRFLASKAIASNSSQSIPMAAIQTISTTLPKPSVVRFKRTTHTIAQFSLVSVSVNLATFAFFILFTPSYNNLIINQLLAAVLVFAAVLKPFLTIVVLYKIDKNVRSALRFKC